MNLAKTLVDRLRADLLDCAGRASAKELPAAVTAQVQRWERELPALLAAEALVEFRKVDQPGRDVDDALAILDLIPERRPGQILPPFPVNLTVPYVLTAEKLRDAWDAGDVDTQTVKLRELIATQDWLNKDDLRRIIKDDKDWSPETLNIEGSPNDLPYVVECKGLCYIYDGHHRLSARYLLAVAKTEVYYLEL